MTFKKVLLFIHRWLGFISGLVVIIVSITGCIYCFQDEIQDTLYSWRKVAPRQQAYVQPSALKKIALSKYPAARVNYIYYFGAGRPAGVLANLPKTGYTDIYLNPYTGQVLHTQVLNDEFFEMVENIHLYLLLPPDIGKWVVGISVLIFLILMITGIILWWPKRKTDRKRSFTIKWNGRWRRINYDLHNVLGFYATSVAIILAISGLAIAFTWVNDAIYTTANLGKTYADEKIEPKSDSLNKSVKTTIPVIDKAFSVAQKQSPKAEMFLIYMDDAALGTIGITAYAGSLHYGNSDEYFFDKYSGKLLRYLPLAKKSTGMKLNELNYDIHVGQALGLTGKILAFLASLICASLPVTGFIVWLGKRKKSKPKPARSVSHRRLHKQLAHK